MLCLYSFFVFFYVVLSCNSRVLYSSRSKFLKLFNFWLILFLILLIKFLNNLCGCDLLRFWYNLMYCLLFLMCFMNDFYGIRGVMMSSVCDSASSVIKFLWCLCFLCVLVLCLILSLVFFVWVKLCIMFLNIFKWVKGLYRSYRGSFLTIL